MKTLDKYNELYKAGLIKHQDMWKQLGYNNETQFWCVRNGKRGMSAKRNEKFTSIVNELYSKMLEFKTMLKDK